MLSTELNYATVSSLIEIIEDAERVPEHMWDFYNELVDFHYNYNHTPGVDD